MPPIAMSIGPVSTYPCGSGLKLLQRQWHYRPRLYRSGRQDTAQRLSIAQRRSLLHAGNNLITDFTTSNPRNQEILRMDYAISDNVHLFGRYNHENESVPWPYGPYNQ